jgi:hypothetical protein
VLLIKDASQQNNLVPITSGSASARIFERAAFNLISLPMR